MFIAKDHNPALAACLTLGSAALAAGTTLLAKALGTGLLGPPMHPLQISHGRFVFALLVIGAATVAIRPRFTKVHLGLHVTRSGLGWGGVSLMFAAAAFIPLSDATAITFLNPVFGMMLAIPLLGEKVGPVRWSAAVIALLGAAVLARPGGGVLEFGALLALGAALLFGIELIAIKLLSRRENPLQILLVNNAVGVVIASAAVVFVWQSPMPAQWVALAAIGVLMAGAQACFINAMARADASFVAPFFYATLIFAALYDRIVFGVVPDAVSVIGACIILTGAGLLAWREGRLKRPLPADRFARSARRSAPMTRSNVPLSPATKLAQALRYLDAETGAIVPAIQPSSTYARNPDYSPRRAYTYRRDGNPTTGQAEAIIADLEGAEASLLFASGMSACTAVIEHLPAHAHVVVPQVMYHGVLDQFRTYAAKDRLDVSYYAAGDLADMASKLRKGETALVWVETPNNPNWDVTDIAAAAGIAHAAGAILFTDCTGTPPCAVKALALGADISFHSATKYLNGHSDITAGVLSVKHTGPYWDEIARIRKLQGTVLHSFDAWLLIRGMRTLMLRYERATQNALRIAQHLAGHPGVEAVLYPGLPSHPGHEIARRQTGGAYGGMMSIIVKGSEETAIDVARSCEVFYPATSLGGVESLIEHRKTVSGEGFPVHPRLLRLSIGIEDADDLIRDLDQALARAGA